MFGISQRYDSPLSNFQLGDVGGREPKSGAAHSSNSVLPSPNDTQAMPILSQGASNGCGTTSLAMIMSFLLDHPVDRSDIDREIRRGGIFTAPNDIVEYARDAGLSAEMYNQGTPEELAAFIDQGVPVQILTTAHGTGEASNLHYVVVTGYRHDKDGNLEFDVHNPWGITEQWTAERLENEWGNTPLGFDHFYIAVGPKGTELPPGRTGGVEGTVAAADGIGSFVAGFDRIITARSGGELWRGVGDNGAGIPQALVGGIVGGLQLSAEYAEHEVRDVPVIGKPLAAGLNHFEERLGTAMIAVNAVSNSMSHLHQAVGHFADGEFVEGLGDLVESQWDLVEGAWDVTTDFVGDTVNDLGDAAAAVVDAGGDIVDAVGTAADAVADATAVAVETVGNAGEVVGSAVGTAVEVVGSAGEAVGSAVGGAVDSIGSWTGWW